MVGDEALKNRHADQKISVSFFITSRMSGLWDQEQSRLMSDLRHEEEEEEEVGQLMPKKEKETKKFEERGS